MTGGRQGVGVEAVGGVHGVKQGARWYGKAEAVGGQMVGGGEAKAVISNSDPGLGSGPEP